jgi:hypothetical protein
LCYSIGRAPLHLPSDGDPRPHLLRSALAPHPGAALPSCRGARTASIGCASDDERPAHPPSSHRPPPCACTRLGTASGRARGLSILSQASTVPTCCPSRPAAARRLLTASAVADLPGLCCSYTPGGALPCDALHPRRVNLHHLDPLLLDSVIFHLVRSVSIRCSASDRRCRGLSAWPSHPRALWRFVGSALLCLLSAVGSRSGEIPARLSSTLAAATPTGVAILAGGVAMDPLFLLAHAGCPSGGHRISERKLSDGVAFECHYPS